MAIIAIAGSIAMGSRYRSFLARIRKSGTRRSAVVKTVAMGRERKFKAYDIGEDTFILEDGIHNHLSVRPSVLIIPKEHLTRRQKGMVMTVTTGNHSVAAFPILDGRFWRLSHLKPEQREEALMKHVLCANIVNDVLEISQRDVASKQLFLSDEWLLKVGGFALNDIIMLDRNEITLDHYRALGQEWRVKPLAWTESGMKLALEASKKRIASKLRYYHSSRGVHFLTFPEFRKFAALAAEPEKLPKFIEGLKEMVAIHEGNRYSFVRMPKYRGHHEIELFGLARGVGMDRIVPELDKLMESIVIAKIAQDHIVKRINGIVDLYESLLTQPEFKDETSRAFVEALYMHVSGEIYSVVGDGSSLAFDDRRTALPGATYVNGVPTFHPGIDDRTKILISNLRIILSKDEQLTSVNVYELHTKGDETEVKVGHGKTREVVYTTNIRPLQASLIEKRITQRQKGYGQYVIARIGALKALGVNLPWYMLLRRRGEFNGRPLDYYIRSRCEGEPVESIPTNYFTSMEDSNVEETEAVLALAMLMGDAAAQNMVMKKFDPATETPLFGEKEIYEFEYNNMQQRIMPKAVATCSIRGAFGWPCLDFTDDNLRDMANYYMGFYAHSLKLFQRKHKVGMYELADRFMEGFEFRTQAMAWQLSTMRERFENFDPKLPRHFNFARKWRFVMWSLERQLRRIEIYRRIFFMKVKVEEHENLRNNP